MYLVRMKIHKKQADKNPDRAHRNWHRNSGNGFRAARQRIRPGRLPSTAGHASTPTHPPRYACHTIDFNAHRMPSFGKTNCGNFRYMLGIPPGRCVRSETVSDRVLRSEPQMQQVLRGEGGSEQGPRSGCSGPHSAFDAS